MSEKNTITACEIVRKVSDIAYVCTKPKTKDTLLTISNQELYNVVIAVLNEHEISESAVAPNDEGKVLTELLSSLNASELRTLLWVVEALIVKKGGK